MPLVKWLTPACMVPIGWPAIRCSNVWCLPKVRPDIFCSICTTTRPRPALPQWDESRVSNSDEEVVITHNWHELRLFMWDFVGIVRTTKRLERALHRVELLQREIQEYYRHVKVSNNLLELRNLTMVAELIIRSRDGA